MLSMAQAPRLGSVGAGLQCDSSEAGATEPDTGSRVFINQKTIHLHCFTK